MKLKAILFDLDGTLINSMPVTLEAFLLGAAAAGRPNLSTQELLKHFGPGEYEIFFRVLGDEKLAQKAYEKYKAELQKRLARAPLHDGVAPLLQKLQQAQIPSGIVTGRSLEMAQILLKHHRVGHHFQTVVSDDEVENHKPAPDGIFLACERMSLKPTEVIYVGDAPMDIKAAKAAGSLSVAAIWDKIFSKASLETTDPHHFADHPEKLLEIFQSY